jgi:hypothetical protein
VEATRLPDKKKEGTKTERSFLQLLLRDEIITREVGVCARNPRAKSFTRSGGGESGLVIVTGRITSAINEKNRGAERRRGREEGSGRKRGGLEAAEGAQINGEGEPEKFPRKKKRDRKKVAIGEPVIPH